MLTSKSFVEFNFTNMEIKHIFKYILILVVMTVGCVSCKGVNASDEFIRIALLKETDHLKLAIKSDYRVVDGKTNAIIAEKRRMRGETIKRTAEGFVIGSSAYPEKHIRIIPKKYFYVGNTGKSVKYRGIVDLIDAGGGKFHVINILDLEKYVRGVLYHEITDEWPMEAMKAQAVAVRTYAKYQMLENHDMLFDVTSDIYSQVYGGKSAERYRTNLAARKTEGEYLTYKSRILPAYFHSNSGGHTEDVRELWKHDLPPLYGVKSPYSVDQPGYNWKRNFRSSDVQKKLNENGFNFGLIKDIRISSRTASGRAKQLIITTRDGKTQSISAKKFRDIVGPNIIRSNLYEIEMKGYFFDLIGHGWGHGVGMCQWGANKMAFKGFSYEEILAYYYPGTVIHKQ